MSTTPDEIIFEEATSLMAEEIVEVAETKVQEYIIIHDEDAEDEEKDV